MGVDTRRLPDNPITALPRVGVDERIAKETEGLFRIREELIAERTHLRSLISEVDQDVIKVERILRPTGLLPTASTPKTPTKKVPAKPTKPGEMLQRIVRFVIESDKPLTRKEVEEGLGISTSVAQKNLLIAKGLGLLRHAGLRPPEGTGGRDSILYSGYPDSLERLRKWSSDGAQS